MIGRHVGDGAGGFQLFQAVHELGVGLGQRLDAGGLQQIHVIDQTHGDGVQRDEIIIVVGGTGDLQPHGIPHVGPASVALLVGIGLLKVIVQRNEPVGADVRVLVNAHVLVDDVRRFVGGHQRDDGFTGRGLGFRQQLNFDFRLHGVVFVDEHFQFVVGIGVCVALLHGLGGVEVVLVAAAIDDDGALRAFGARHCQRAERQHDDQHQGQNLRCFHGSTLLLFIWDRARPGNPAPARPYSSFSRCRPAETRARL